ncbi:MAG: HAMP domain-containing histidine kinase [Sphingomonas sp.]|nr:HAMP domain-containing histidine kinase [Sphingomonas sp.]
MVFAVQILLSGIALTYVYVATSRTVEAEERAIVTELGDDLLTSYRAGGDAALAALIETRLAKDQGEVVALFIDRNGKIRAGNLSAWPATIGRSTGWRTMTLYRIGGSDPETIGVIAKSLSGQAKLLVGRVIDANVRLLRISIEVIVTALLAAVPLASLLAILLGRFFNQRLRMLNITAAAVAAGNLAQRAPRDGSEDPFDALAGSVNAMLERIELLVGELRIVTDGIAHDMRSPLTRLKAVIEQARQKTSDDAALAALEQVSREADLLLAMLATALQIARVEAGVSHDRFVTVDIETLLSDLVEVFGPSAEEQGVMLVDEKRAEPIGKLLLHRDLVLQSLSNLVENALRYAEGTRVITVSAEPTTEGVCLIVADNGLGIPADRREEAKHRFVRLDPSRHLGGSGLGLALVEAVARLHNGSLVLEDNHPGLRAIMRLSVQWH